MKLLTPDRKARMSPGRRRFLQSSAAVTLVGLTRKASALLPIGGSASGAAPSGNFTASSLTYLGGFMLPSTLVNGGTMGLGPTKTPPMDGQSTSQTLYVYKSTSANGFGGFGSVFLPMESLLYTGTGTPNITAAVDIAAPSANNLQNAILTNPSQSSYFASNDVVLSAVNYDSANARMLFGYFGYYPNGTQTYNVASMDTNLTVGSITLNMRITGTANAVSLDGCNMACGWGPIASAYQSELGGTLIGTLGGIAVDSRSGYGTPLVVFNPSTLTPSVNVTSKPWVFYPHTNAVDSYAGEGSAGEWDINSLGGLSAFNALAANNYYSSQDNANVAFVPSGYSQAVIFGLHGAGKQIYGVGTTNSALNGTPDTSGGGGTFTGTIGSTSGITQITGVTGLVGGIPGGSVIMTVDGNGFNAGGISQNTGTVYPTAGVTSYNSGTGVITLNSGAGAITATATGTFNFACSPSNRCLAYDPVQGAGSGPGGHAWPYPPYLWVYNLSDLLSAGNTYTPQPVYVGQVPYPGPTSQNAIRFHSGTSGQACVDIVNKRIYMPILENTGSGGNQCFVGVWGWT